MLSQLRRRDGRIATAALAILFSGCAGGSVPATTSTRPAQPGTTASTALPAALNVTAVAGEMIERANASRRASGLPALSRNAKLMSAAQLQADQMVKAGVMAHELPDQPYPTLRSRLLAVQYALRAAGENISEGQRSAAEAQSTWMDSPLHRANILSLEFTEFGTGVAAARNGRLYFVQVAGRPTRPASGAGQD
ncbi:MAG: CAP domain-containing protein [Gemmatimonadaceae bacterium]